jgi:cytochrome c-type biogenesis protein CcmH
MRYLPILTLLFVFATTFAMAVEPDEMLSDPVLEARARTISKELRCVVCQNQDIDSSNAGVARDLRLLVRERLEAGDTNEEVIAFVQARYGDYVLLRPPFKPTTYVLWLAPPVLTLIILVFGWRVLTGYRQKRSLNTLTVEEEALVERFVADHKNGGRE